MPLRTVEREKLATRTAVTHCEFVLVSSNIADFLRSKGAMGNAASQIAETDAARTRLIVIFISVLLGVLALLLVCGVIYMIQSSNSRKREELMLRREMRLQRTRRRADMTQSVVLEVLEKKNADALALNKELRQQLDNRFFP